MCHNIEHSYGTLLQITLKTHGQVSNILLDLFEGHEMNICRGSKDLDLFLCRDTGSWTDFEYNKTYYFSSCEN